MTEQPSIHGRQSQHSMQMELYQVLWQEQAQMRLFDLLEQEQRKAQITIFNE